MNWKTKHNITISTENAMGYCKHKAYLDKLCLMDHFIEMTQTVKTANSKLTRSFRCKIHKHIHIHIHFHFLVCSILFDISLRVHWFCFHYNMNVILRFWINVNSNLKIKRIKRKSYTIFHLRLVHLFSFCSIFEN